MRARKDSNEDAQRVEKDEGASEEQGEKRDGTLRSRTGGVDSDACLQPRD